MADFVVGVGPKLTEAFRKYLGFWKKHEDVFEFTPAKSVAALSDTVLVFVGAPDRKHEEIAKRFVDFGIPEKHLRVRGYMNSREALKQLFCEVDLVLMPSRTEGFGLTGLEALSAGLPVIVSKNSGFGEALGSLPSGSFFVIDSEDHSAWIEAMKDVWNKDRKSRLDEVKALRGSYSERYSWSEQCKHLIEKMFKLVDAEPEITALAVGARELKLTENFTARTSCPSYVVEGIRQVYKKCEGVILPVPWCEEFNFQIEDIFTRLRIVEKEKTRGIAITKEVTNMTSIFTPHECCEQPLIVLIEGEPGMGKTTYCQKLIFDWASKQCREWDESFPRIEVLLLLRCRGIKSTIWDAIEEQIMPEEIELGQKEMFFQFLKENPSKVLLVLDGLDEADPQTLKICLQLIQGKQLPGCYIVITSRHEAGKKVRPYADTLLEIVGFTTADAECYMMKYFQHAEHLADELISKVLFDKDLRELTQNPLNTLLLCVIFEDLQGILPTNRTQLYLEIVLLILRRYESKNGLSNRGEDLLLVYKKELMILGETALDCLRKQELYFDDHKGDIKESLLIKFGFLSIQSSGSKRAPCDRYGFFHKSFQEFFSGYFLAISIIDDVTNSHSVLTDTRYMPRGELFQVFKFMSGIIAKQSKETAVSIVQSIASVVNEIGRVSHRYASYLEVAHYFVNECKTGSEELYTELVRAFGASLDLVNVVMRPPSVQFTSETMESPELVEVVMRPYLLLFTIEGIKSLNLGGLVMPYFLPFTSEAIDTLAGTFVFPPFIVYENEVAGTFFQALTFNSTVSKLKMFNWNFCTTNLLAQALREAQSLAQALRVNTSLSSLNLCLNSIGDEGANSLAQALGVNTVLSLNLPTNCTSDEGAILLPQAPRERTSPPLYFYGPDW
ncbi:PREDICTED: NACHT, LRR and PYD domains-containing protein 3-like [Acropora digitifera]|uniref:NACHT, LRR and PYD domains-containing protein 3-like n=1 Tax=Acropora digitifera TaxID=70779 RepID=UPI00077A42C4|nr:PREDICTED: NACHT, LRR and PYD domains-containing protein 3-like [Acropora digitifera]